MPDVQSENKTKIQIAFSQGWNEITTNPLPPEEIIKRTLFGVFSEVKAKELGRTLAIDWYGA